MLTFKNTAEAIQTAAGGPWILRWLLIAILTLLLFVLILLITGYEFTLGGAKFRVGRPAPADQTAVTREELIIELKNVIRYDDGVNLINGNSNGKEGLIGFIGGGGTRLDRHNPAALEQRWILKRSP